MLKHTVEIHKHGENHGKDHQQADGEPTQGDGQCGSVGEGEVRSVGKAHQVRVSHVSPAGEDGQGLQPGGKSQGSGFTGF